MPFFPLSKQKGFVSAKHPSPLLGILRHNFLDREPKNGDIMNAIPTPVDKEKK
jgi:hypothetical protein